VVPPVDSDSDSEEEEEEDNKDDNKDDSKEAKPKEGEATPGGLFSITKIDLSGLKASKPPAKKQKKSKPAPQKNMFTDIVNHMTNPNPWAKRREFRVKLKKIDKRHNFKQAARDKAQKAKKKK
jgi:hypothetical protein